jgi:H+/gluconate symporter-like permease
MQVFVIILNFRFRLCGDKVFFTSNKSVIIKMSNYWILLLRQGTMLSGISVSHFNDAACYLIDQLCSIHSNEHIVKISQEIIL